MNKKYRILDLFSGAGGFSYGLHLNDNFETKIAIDFNKSATETFKYNMPDVEVIHGDITDTDIKNKIISSAKELGVNMIIGGPPCQGFSIQGKRLGLNDPRNFLFLEYINLVEQIRPEIFIIENVKNLVYTADGYFLKEIYNRFQALGYSLNHKILNASDYGVPQNRERVFIIGVLNNKSISMDISELAHKTTVRDAISDLAYLNSAEGNEISDYITQAESEYQRIMRDNSSSLYNHKATNHKPIAIEKLKLIPAECDKSYLPKHMLGRQQHSCTWGRLVWDKQSNTIDTRFDTPAAGKNSHPYLHRAITPREAARLQSFPDKFRFLGTKTEIGKQIGNAVPPLLAKAIGQHILKTLGEIR